MKAKINAKLAIRIAILTVGMVGTFIAASFQPISISDGGPIILCPQKDKKACNLPPLG